MLITLCTCRVLDSPVISASRLTALHARAKAYKESGQLEMASADLGEALRLSPHNRDLHKMILQVKEMIRKRDEAEEGGAIGANAGDDIKYLDETITSEIGDAATPTADSGKDPEAKI